MSAAAAESARPPTQERADGLFPGISYAEYATWDARRSHVLAQARTSAAHMRRASVEVERDPTRDFELGIAVHCAILEPERFEARFVCGLARGKQSNADKAAHAMFALEQAAHYREVLSYAEYERALRIRDQLARKPWRQGLLGGAGVAELSILWTADESEVRCAARPDRLTLQYLHPRWSEPAPVLVSLKTARSATPDGFRRAISEHSYHVQARHELDGMAAHDPRGWLDPGTLEPRPEQYVWIVLEKQEPFDAALYSPSTEMLEAAELRLRHALALWSECEREGRWPGFPDVPELVDLLPWDRPPGERARRARWSGEPRTRHAERDALEGEGDGDAF